MTPSRMERKLIYLKYQNIKMATKKNLELHATSQTRATALFLIAVQIMMKTSRLLCLKCQTSSRGCTSLTRQIMLRANLEKHMFVSIFQINLWKLKLPGIFQSRSIKSSNLLEEMSSMAQGLMGILASLATTDNFG